MCTLKEKKKKKGVGGGGYGYVENVGGGGSIIHGKYGERGMIMQKILGAGHMNKLKG